MRGQSDNPNHGGLEVVRALVVLGLRVVVRAAIRDHALEVAQEGGFGLVRAVLDAFFYRLEVDGLGDDVEVVGNLDRIDGVEKRPHAFQVLQLRQDLRGQPRERALSWGAARAWSGPWAPDLLELVLQVVLVTLALVLQAAREVLVRPARLTQTAHALESVGSALARVRISAEVPFALAQADAADVSLRALPKPGEHECPLLSYHFRDLRGQRHGGCVGGRARFPSRAVRTFRKLIAGWM